MEKLMVSILLTWMYTPEMALKVMKINKPGTKTETRNKILNKRGPGLPR